MRKIIPIIIVLVVVGGGAFYGGMRYGKNKTTGEIGQERQQRVQQFDASKVGSFQGIPGGGFVAG